MVNNVLPRPGLRAQHAAHLQEVHQRRQVAPVPEAHELEPLGLVRVLAV